MRKKKPIDLETSEKEYLASSDLNYQRDIDIDQDRLDKEWIRQPELFLRWSEKAALARGEAERTKERLAVVKAEVDAEIRTHAEKKPSEAQIFQMVIMDKRVRKAESENIEAWERYGLLYAAKEAFEHRKASLENLVKLHGQQYFSSPHYNKENQEALRNETNRSYTKTVTDRIRNA